MKILIAHNYYQRPGGEDRSFFAESALLEKHGHTVFHYTLHNDQINSMKAVPLALATLWNHKSYQSTREHIRKFKPELVHIHNTFPLMSPSVYYAAKTEGIPVVQKLGNFRLLCPAANFIREGRICEDCSGKLFKWPSILHSCYRESRTASATVAIMLTAHDLFRTWTKKIDMIIVRTQFAREKFISAGISSKKISIQPNFVDPPPAFRVQKSNNAIFIGRLSVEKGIHTLLDAWKQLPNSYTLKIVGDGPLAELVRQSTITHANIEWVEWQSPDTVLSLLQQAAVLIFPSICYEMFGRVIIEAFAAGTPVIASKLGSPAEIVQNQQTGLHFEAGDPTDLIDKIRWLFEHPNTLSNMQQQARIEYETKYTAECIYDQLMAIYDQTLANSGRDTD